MSITKKEENPSGGDVSAFVKYLKGNEDKLKILLCGDEKSKPLLYPIKGKRATKTIFMSEKLQFLMNEYCIENELKIGDFVESAIIQCLVQKGYSEKLKPILNTCLPLNEQVGQ